MGAVYCKSPVQLRFAEGVRICTIENEGFPGVLSLLREKMIPLEEGPYADNKDGDIGKFPWWMGSKIGKGGLGEEIMLLTDILMPRRYEFAIPVEGPQGEVAFQAKTKLLDVEKMRSHKDFEFVLKELPDYGRETDDLMTPGRIFKQEKWEEKGSKYLLLTDSFELAFIGTAIMRACGREAYVTQMKGLVRVGDGKDDFQEGIVGEGVAVFTDDRTMSHFGFELTHQCVMEFNILSDHAAMSTLWLLNAAHRIRKEMKNFDHLLRERDSTADEKLLDAKIKGLLEIVKIAEGYMPENPHVTAAREGIAKERELRLSHLLGMGEFSIEEMARSYVADVVKFVRALESELEDKGLAQKKKVGPVSIGYTSGVKPEEAEKRVRFAIDALAAGFKKYGDRDPLREASHYVTEFIEKGLGDRFKIPIEYLTNLRRALREKDVQFEGSWVPEVRVGGQENVPEAMCTEALQLKLFNLHKEIHDSGGKLPVDEVRVKAKGIIDHLCAGFAQFGLDSEPLIEFSNAMGTFYMKMLNVKYGYSTELATELYGYYAQKMEGVSK
jgi:hypothetical protein